MFYCDVTDEQFQQLVSQLKPWGVPVLVFHRRDKMRHLETRGQKGFYMGPGSGPSMDTVFLGAGVESAVLISRQRHKSTPDMVYDVFIYVTDKAHAEAFGQPPL